jgi:predicted nuclease of predicted toxin-antitoxin system
MKLLLDEDSQGNALVRLLRDAGHDIVTVAEAGLAGQDDPAILAYAKNAGRVLLTRNGKDFLMLHQADSSHAGILVEHQDAAPSKNMTYRQIVTAIAKIEASGWDLRRELVGINAWQ